MSCSCTTTGGGTVVKGSGPIGVAGSGTPTDPYIITEATGSGAAIEVRDSSTVNMTLFGSGTKADPYVIRADTGSASSLQSLADVSPTPAVAQGAVPLWIGSAATGQFQFRTPGTRYTTNATRGTGLYLGEVIRETDTGTRFEWDGTQWVSLTPTPAAQFVLDSSVVVAAGGIGATGPDLNTLTTRSGIYRVAGTPSNINMPSGAYNFGTLVVFVNGNSVTQRYSAHGNGQEYVRTKWNDSDWTSWNRIAFAGEVDSVSSRVTNLQSYADQINQRVANEEGNRNSRDNDLINDYRGRDDGLRNDYISRIAQVDSKATVQGAGYGSVGLASNVYVNGGIDLVKFQNIVTLRFNININGGKNVNDVLISVPDGFRPRNFPADFFCHNGSSLWGAAIDTDGGLRLRTASIGGGGLWGSVAYQTN